MNVKTTCLAILVALGFLVPRASADNPKRYTVSIGTVSTAAGQELQPGSYKLVVHTHDPKIHFQDVKSGKEIEIEAKVEVTEQKFENTSVLSDRSGGTARIVEIKLAGSRTRLVFE